MLELLFGASEAENAPLNCHQGQVSGLPLSLSGKQHLTIALFCLDTFLGKGWTEMTRRKSEKCVSRCGRDSEREGRKSGLQNGAEAIAMMRSREHLYARLNYLSHLMLNISICQGLGSAGNECCNVVRA